jgi:septum site-determining protein MinD
MLGLSDIVYDLGDLLEGRCSISSAILPSPNVVGLYAIVAPVSLTGPISMQDMRLLIDGLRGYFDLVILDMPAGLGTGVQIACAVSDLALVVTTPDPVCVRDGNQVVREMLAGGFTAHRLIINRVNKRMMRRQVIRDLDEVIDGVGSQLIGVVPEDPEVALFSSHGRLPDPKGELQQVCRAMIARINGQYVPLIVR